MSSLPNINRFNNLIVIDELSKDNGLLEGLLEYVEVLDLA